MPFHPIVTIGTAVDLTSDGSGDVFNFQRREDEDGAWQIQVNQEPDDGALAGSIVLEGRLLPELGWAVLDTVDLTDLSGAAAYPYSLIRTLSGKVVTQMRYTVTGSTDVAASTTAEVVVQQ